MARGYYQVNNMGWWGAAKVNVVPDDLPHINKNLQDIENNFLQKCHADLLKESNDDSLAAKAKIEAEAKIEAKARTIVYLCLAFNPYREKMVTKDLIKNIGLRAIKQTDEIAQNNLTCLKKLTNELKRNPELVRREILYHMAEILLGKDWQSQIQSNKSNEYRIQNDMAQILISKFQFAKEDLERLATTCMHGSQEVYRSEQQLANQRQNPTFNGTFSTLTLFGGVGGVFAGKALVGGLTAAGVAISATGGGAIILGAIILAAGAVAAITYGLYSLFNYCKTQYNYSQAAGVVSHRYGDTIETFMDDNSKAGALPNLTASLSK